MLSLPGPPDIIKRLSRAQAAIPALVRPVSGESIMFITCFNEKGETWGAVAPPCYVRQAIQAIVLVAVLMSEPITKPALSPPLVPA